MISKARQTIPKSLLLTRTKMCSQACVHLLELVGLVDAFGVLIEAEARGLEELLEAAVERVNSERAEMLREPMFQKTMLRFFQRNFSDWADPPL